MPVFRNASSQTLTLKLECRKLRDDRSMFFPGVCSSLSKKPDLSSTLALNLKAPKKINCKMGEEWSANSGATTHFTPHIDDFVNYRNLKEPVELCLSNGRWVMGLAVGDVDISPYLKLRNVLYVGGFDEDLTC